MANNTALLRRLAKKLRNIPEIKLAYLFGSRARNDFGPASDYDFAFYLNERNKKKCFDIKCLIGNMLAKELKHDKFDIVILDHLDSPELAFQIVQEGKILVDEEPYRMMLEPQIINIHEDHIMMLKRNRLTLV